MTEDRKPTKPVIAPYFSLVRATWIACAVEWDSETGEVRRLEGFQAFASYQEALEASRFLARREPPLDKADYLE